MQNYLLLLSNDDDTECSIIHDPKTKLKVKVFETVKDQFIPSKGEVRFFATTKDQTVAFETEGYHKHRELLILEMISWYCKYQGLLTAQIHYNWPIAS